MPPHAIASPLGVAEAGAAGGDATGISASEVFPEALGAAFGAFDGVAVGVGWWCSFDAGGAALAEDVADGSLDICAPHRPGAHDILPRSAGAAEPIISAVQLIFPPDGGASFAVDPGSAAFGTFARIGRSAPSVLHADADRAESRPTIAAPTTG